MVIQQSRDRRRWKRETVAKAEQMLQWEAEGHPHHAYITTWYRGTGFKWEPTPGYWPDVAARAELDSRSEECSRVVVTLPEPANGPYYTEWTWENGQLIGQQRSRRKQR